MVTTDVRKELNASTKLVSKIRKIRISEDRCLVMDLAGFSFFNSLEKMIKGIYPRRNSNLKHFVKERAHWQIVS